MKIFIKKELSGYMLILIFLSPVYAAPITLSFDTRSSITWYEKGVRSLLSVWHELKTAQQNEMLFDAILGKLTFTQYCLDHVVKEGEPILQQEKNYCCMILDKIVSFFCISKSHSGKFENSDYVNCLDNMIESIVEVINQVNVITP